MTGLRIAAAGDAGLLIELPPSLDPATSARVIGLGRAVRDRCAGMIHDVVVGYCSLTVYFDPLAIDPVWLEGEVRRLADDASAAEPDGGEMIDVPVCYGGELGPDLAEVAAAAGCSEADVIALHSGRVYRVYLLGFMPGFPYMAEVDPRIALPRRASPRVSVPPGSVAIAAGQTAIYPAASPGGWHLIGRTRVKPYDPDREQPFLFSPGDTVRFRPIDRAAFEQRA